MIMLVIKQTLWLNSDLIPRLLENVEFRKFFTAVLFIINKLANTKILRCVAVSVGEFCTKNVLKQKGEQSTLKNRFSPILNILLIKIAGIKIA